MPLLCHNQCAPLLLFSHILSSHMFISYSMEIFPLKMGAQPFKWLDVSSEGSFSYSEQREEEKAIWKQNHVEGGNRRVYIKEAYLRKISVLRRKKVTELKMNLVLYYLSWFSEGILTACFVGWIPFLIQVQCISPNAGQSASCMETEDADTSFWLWTCRNAELLCVIFLQRSKAVIWKTIDLIVLVRKMVKITDFNEFSQERLKAWILVFIHMFYLENRGKLGKRPCFAATVKCSRVVRNTSFPWIFLHGTFWGSCPPGLWGPLVC